MSSGSTSTTTSSMKLSPELQAAYSGILSQENNLAGSNYTGELTAGLTDAQKQAMQQLSGISSTSSPYFSLAQAALQSGTNPIQAPVFSQSAVDQYMSPYTNDVINSTLAVLNQQDAQQANQLRGSAAAAGALGTDRAGVAQAALAGQQSLANNQTISGLYNQAYQQALSQYNTMTGQQLGVAESNRNANLSAAGTYAGLGSADVANQLAANEALMNAGTVAQQTQQNADTAGYQKYLQQYTNLADLASILGSAASATGSQISQTKKNAPIFEAGGHVPRRADGGYMPAPDVSALYARPPTQVPVFHLGDAGRDGAGDNGQSVMSGFAGNLKGLAGANQSLKDLGEAGGLSGAAADAGSWLGDAGIAALSFLGLHDGGATHLAMGGLPVITRDLVQEPVRHPPKAATIGMPRAVKPFSVPRVSMPRMRLADGGYADDMDDLPEEAIVAAPRMNLADASTDRLASPEEVPHFWNDFATHAASTAPSQPTSLADAATVAPAVSRETISPQPETFWQRIGLTQGNGTGVGINHRPGSPGWGLPLLAAIGKGLETNNVGAALSAGASEYARESELDQHPTVDNSGPTSRIYYPSEKKWVDTGLPTEAAQYRQYQHDYQQQLLGIRQQTADDRAQAEKDAAANRATQLRIAEINVNAGRYTPIPMNGIDPAHPERGPVPGVMAFNQKTSTYQFIPGYSKQDPNALPAPGTGGAPWTQFGNGATTPVTPPPPPVTPPAGFNLAGDGKYYKADPKRPGKFLMWTP